VSDLLEKAPGATSDATGLVLSGGTGLENTYYLDGLNITSLKNGALGTNLFVPFLDEVEIVSAGYGAEYGRALGGVVNMATKSGSNEWHASAFSYLSPGAFSGGQQRIASRGSSLTGVTEPDYSTTLGAEVGGPIIKNKLFFWVGYAPRLSTTTWSNTLTDSSSTSIQAPVSLTGPRPTIPMAPRQLFLCIATATRARPPTNTTPANSPGN